MDIKRQERAPIYEALEEFKKKRVVPFDVPGHKRGRGNPELVHLLGEKCVGLDVNSMKPLDNLCHPVSVIREAEELAAVPPPPRRRGAARGAPPPPRDPPPWLRRTAAD